MGTYSVKYNSSTFDFFKKYFINSQNSYDGSWTHHQDENIVAKTVYTSQVLIALYFLPLDSELSKTVKKAVNFLLTTKTKNNLYDIYLKFNALSYWEDYIPKEELDRKLHREIINYFEYGGRLNSFSFELCFILETLLKTKVIESLNIDIKKRIDYLLNDFISQPFENIIDISHLIWAINLSNDIGNDVPSSAIKQLHLALLKYPQKEGYFVIKARKGRSSKTPVLRSNEFLTAHIVLGVSRLLKIRYDAELYKLISKYVELIVDNFHSGEFWAIDSMIIGIVENDPYFNALNFRTLLEYSQLSKSAYENSIGRIEVLVKDIEPEIRLKKDKSMLFISHSEKDKNVASKLIDFVENSLQTDTLDIRCSSVPGYQLPFGKTISQQLKEDINKSSFLVVIISENSLISEWVLFELGAAWALDIPVVPILVGDLTYKNMPGPLGSQSCIETCTDGASNRLRDAIKQM